MFSTGSGINLSVILSSLVKLISTKPKQQKNKTHDYTRLVCGRDYVFEPIDNQTRGYMTGQGRGIKSGDYIIFQNGSSACKYQVEEIDYYSEPPDMWMALLKKDEV
ncbi:MAG: hypothetical protein PUP92_08585 [Rhizonema sp. PD38]|nr:hypothetical protein [Rhizonema sp. PD38]